MFRRYRDDKDWAAYEAAYVALLKDRDVEHEIGRELFEEGAVLLCTEPTPERCHRRLAAEMLQRDVFREAAIEHL